MGDNIVVGIDIAKSIFHVCVMSREGRVLRRERLSRNKVLEFFSNFERCLVAMESCGGSSYWARELKSLGFEVKLIAAQFVKPFVKSQKNDAIDAEAICEAALRPQMRFVSANTLEQQDLQNIHRVRERLVKQRTALSNQIRGLLMEYGIVFPRSINKLLKEYSEMIDEVVHSERALWRQTFVELRDELSALSDKIANYDLLLANISKSHPVCASLRRINGIGPITSTAIVAAVSNPLDYKNGRQFSAWLGLVPQQNSTGGKPTLGGISKRGNKYIRKLLIHGARRELQLAKKRGNLWLIELQQRRGFNKAAVALANKNARRVWRVLAYGHQEQVLQIAA